MTNAPAPSALISPEFVIVARRWIYGLAFIFFLATNWGNSFASGSTLIEYIYAHLAGRDTPSEVLGGPADVARLADTTIRFLMFMAMGYVIDRLLERLSFRLCDIGYLNRQFEALEQERLKILQNKVNLMEYEVRLCEHSHDLTKQFDIMEARIQDLIRLRTH